MPLLSNFCKIARTKLISGYPYQEPNPTLNIGIFQENMGSLPQVELLKAVTFKPIVQNTVVDTSYKNVGGAGIVAIPETKDFYVGEMYGY